MTTVRKIFVYDPQVDTDIDEWINGIKLRERSKYIRIAIRTWINNNEHVTNEHNTNNTERISFTYDDLEDRDIHLWFEKLPKRGQSDYIKRAIRNFISDDANIPKTRVSPPTNVDEEKIIKKNNDIENIDNKTEGKEEGFIDLNNDFLDNIGK